MRKCSAYLPSQDGDPVDHVQAGKSWKLCGEPATVTGNHSVGHICDICANRIRKQILPKRLKLTPIKKAGQSGEGRE